MMETSHFIRLSSEIRNEIWFHTFTSPYALKLQNGTLQHPLTQTCRQIRGETLGMFHAMTRFNAHLENGPTTPLLKWLRGQDPQHLLVISELNVWDLHHLNGTLYGEETARAVLLKGPQDTSKKYILQPVAKWVFAEHGFQKVLKEIILALHSVGLGLLRFCIVDRSYDEDDDLDDENEEKRVSPTSSFALVWLDSRPAGEIFTDSDTNIDWLAHDNELSECARAELIHRLADGQVEVEILDGMRRLIFDFTSLELGGRIKDVRSMDESGWAGTDRYSLMA